MSWEIRIEPSKPKKMIDDLVDHIAGEAVDVLNIEPDLCEKVWRSAIIRVQLFE